MALTGELTYKGLTISNAYMRVTRVFHSSDFDPDSNAKVLKADYSAKIYKDASTCASSPLEEITIVISRPLILSILSKFTSGKIICSLIPKV